MRKPLFLGMTSAMLLIIIVGAFIWGSDVVSPLNKKADVAMESGIADFPYVSQRYSGHISVDVEQKNISGNIQVNAINKSQVEQKAIYFHLYPNAFKNSESLWDENWEYVLGKKRISGWTEIGQVLVNGKESSFEIQDTILEVPVDSWAAGEEIQVDLQFQVQVPKNDGRLSYDEHAIWLGNWLPIVAEYDDQGWYLDPYYPIGDPFYSDVAHYNLEIELPLGYQLASSGLEQTMDDGERRIYRVQAEQVRDLAVVIMDDTYEKISEEYDGITINTWYRNNAQSSVVERLHKVGLESIADFSQWYGKYPYPEYDIVQTGGFFGGMEYPGIVFIQEIYFERNDDYGVVVVAHETAHQWWYGVVGNNEVSDPWMDEGLTEYSTMRFLLDRYPAIGKSVLKSKEQSLTYAQRYERAGEYVGSSVDAFSNWDSYGLLVYNKGAVMFYRLEQAIGVEEMHEILRDYVEQYQYKNADVADMIAVFEKHLGESVRHYFETWLNGGEVEM